VKTRDQVDRRAFGARLKQLADYAAAGGAPADWLDATMAALLTALLERVDPRRKRALALGRRMQAARAAGASIPEIAQSFARSRSQVHRLLADVARDHATVSVFTPRRPRRGGSG
jgi:hypothetical protein